MSPSFNIEQAILNIENALKWQQCPESIREDVRTLILFVRETLEAMNDPTDATIMSEARRLAVSSGLQFSKLTRDQLSRLVAEALQKIEMRRKSPLKRKR